MVDVVIPGFAAPASGTNSIVILGPNGVGKTRLGVTIARQNNADRVAALRNVEIPEIPMQRLDQATQQVKSALQEVLNQHWRQSYELQNLMSEILAEDREYAVQYRNDREGSPSIQPDEKFTNTRLRRIVRIWNRHFPGRCIEIDYQPHVVRNMPDGRTARYPISQMSEGERTALYLAARVVSCQTQILIVDEPESFFHPLLARNLWSDLEAEAPNMRFIYITHDIPFALSRRDAAFAIARSEGSAELLPQASSIPADVIADVLGAASFSISASRLIFCEGVPTSVDGPLLNAWHDCAKTAIVPVGSCNAVRECVSVFRAQGVTGGLEAFGYVDRDGWPDSLLMADAFVKAHPVNEMEGYVCIEPIFKALAVYNGSDAAGSQNQFDAFLTEAKGQFRGAPLNKEILNRAKMRVENEQKAMLNPVKPNPDLDITRTAFTTAAPPGGWSSYMAIVFQEEEQRLSDSLSTSPEAFTRDFPAKSYFTVAAKHLRYTPDKLLETLCKALRLSNEDAKSEQNLKLLRDTLVSVLETHFWPRKA